MRILITGICGFVGASVARQLLKEKSGLELVGVDNFIRPGSESNRVQLKSLGVRLIHGDIRMASDLESVGTVDWVIDTAANPSVLAGVDGQSSSRQVIEHNLSGTIHLLEFCKVHGAGFTLLSTSRVYSIPPLANLSVRVEEGAFVPDPKTPFPKGLSENGVAEDFSTMAPVSLYGSSKLASETLALEYGATFDFPVWINRCGVLAGAGQFGRADQGIFAFWLNSWLREKPLKYIGFDGTGHQVRDILHPEDLVPVLLDQMDSSEENQPRVSNFSGGAESALSLRQLSAWCATRWGHREVGTIAEDRPFDIPWMVLDASQAKAAWNWEPRRNAEDILEEIALHAEANPEWLEISAPL